ncbi:MAG: hypothetical protein AB8H47_09700 [Bacteroidia bacterium]
MEAPAKQKSSFVNVIAWLMMGFGAFGFVVGSLQLFFFKFVGPVNFSEELPMQPEDFIGQYIGFVFGNMPYILSIFLVGYVLQFGVGFGLWKRKNWAWMSSIAVFVVLLLGTIGIGIGQQILYNFMFSEFPDPGLEDATFMSLRLIFHLMSGLMMLAFALLWSWIIYRLSRPEIRAEFV